MKSRMLVLFLLLSISLFNFASASAQDGNSASMLQPPETEKKPKITEINGDRMVDNYFWLREKTNPAVIAHLEAENAYTAAMMKPTEALQEKLYNDILSHIKQTDVNVPYRQGGYYYFSKTKEGLQYPMFYRKKGSLDAPEEVEPGLCRPSDERFPTSARVGCETGLAPPGHPSLFPGRRAGTR